MKLTVNQSDLSINLSLVSRAVASRPSHPILANILLVADATTKTITLNAFDLSLGIQVSFKAAIEDGGKLTLPAKLLTDIVSRLSDGVLQFEATETEGAWDVAIVSDSGRYNIRGMSADEFPELPSIDDGQILSLPSSALVEGLLSTLFSTSTDETKVVLTGAHITALPDGLEIAGCDGHRLTTWRSVWEEERETASDLAVTVPAKALQELVKMLERSDSVAVSYDPSQIIFEMGTYKLTSRLLEGQYPNYQQLIPKAFTRQITAERRLLLSALERVAVLADQKNNIAKLSLDFANQQIIITVDAQDVGSAKETIPAQITGDDLDIAFNVKYLMDGLKAIATTEIQMQLNTATSPAIVIPLGGAKMVVLIMPVQCKS